MAALIDKGDVRFAFHHRVLWPQSQLAHEAAECAGDQGKYWEYHGQLLENQSKEGFPQDKLLKLAQAVGLDTKTFGACVSDHKYADKVNKETQEAANLGVASTPTFMINGRIVTNYNSFDELVALVKKEVNK